MSRTGSKDEKFMGKKSPVIGVYRGNIVVIRSVNKRSVDLNRNILKELTTVSIKVFKEN